MNMDTKKALTGVLGVLEACKSKENNTQSTHPSTP
jgi:hypothetical protein